MPLIRFGVSIDKILLSKFDRFIKDKKYTNRSEAFRDLIRHELIQQQWKGCQEIAGAIILHGPHQPAQKSTKTGSSESKTSFLKLASVKC